MSRLSPLAATQQTVSPPKKFKPTKVLQRAAHRVTVTRAFDSQMLAAVKTGVFIYMCI